MRSTTRDPSTPAHDSSVEFAYFVAMMRDKLPELAWISLAVIWGSTFIFMKWAVAYITPLQLVFTRVILGLLPVMVYATYKKQLRIADLRHAHHFLAMALLAGSVYFYGFARGVSLLPSSIAGAVSAAIPLFTMVAALLFLPDEKLTRALAVGLLMGCTGVVMIAQPFESDTVGTSLAGVSWMVGGCLSLGVSFVYARKYVVPLGIPAAAITTYQLGFATILLALVTDLRGIDTILVDAQASVGLALGLGVLATGVAYLIYYYIVETMGAVRASSVTYLSPIVALLIGAGLAGETVRLLQYAAAALIFGGVAIINRERKNSTT